MKKSQLLILGMMTPILLSAQDMVLLRSGEEIHCKVDMINNGIVSYQSNGVMGQLPTTQLYMIKYEKRGNAFFDSNGESSYNTESSSNKLSKKDIAIYLCDGFEVIASDINVTSESVSYRAVNKKGWNALTGFIPNKKNEEWNVIPKEKVFVIRYSDGTKEVINDLQKQEEQARLDALPKVKHPFVPINKNEKFPCPAELELNDGKGVSIIIYDMDREYVHYRKKEWQDGPIFRMQRLKIKNVIIK